MVTNQLKLTDIDMMIPHQANLRINQMVAQMIGMPPEKTHNETSLWTALLTLGRAMIALYLARVVARPRAKEYVHDGAEYAIMGTEACEVGTRFGKVAWEQPVGRRIACVVPNAIGLSLVPSGCAADSAWPP